MLYEIWSGKLIADEMRDPAIIQQAAHNVLLLDAVLQRYTFQTCHFSIFSLGFPTFLVISIQNLKISYHCNPYSNSSVLVLS